MHSLLGSFTRSGRGSAFLPLREPRQRVRQFGCRVKPRQRMPLRECSSRTLPFHRTHHEKVPDMLIPVILPANQPPDRFYQGGDKITAFRGQATAVETAVTSEKTPRETAIAGCLHIPEDWVASVTCLAGDTRLGLTVLPDGRTLADAIESDPHAWLGPDHVAAFGSDTKLLVKLLDAGQRLPVHAHPGTTFAHDHLGRTHGKAEAWYILQGG